jgi:ribonucleotide monophosphatase NagD (HAD superfamily)
VPLSPLLTGYDSVVLDLDGCVWVGEAATPGAAEAISALRAAGKRLVFLTNDGRRSPEEYVRKLWSLGVQGSLEEVMTVGAAIQYLLAGRDRTTVYVIGSPALFRHVGDAGHRIVNGTGQATRAELVMA